MTLSFCFTGISHIMKWNGRKRKRSLEAVAWNKWKDHQPTGESRWWKPEWCKVLYFARATRNLANKWLLYKQKQRNKKPALSLRAGFIQFHLHEINQPFLRLTVCFFSWLYLENIGSLTLGISKEKYPLKLYGVFCFSLSSWIFSSVNTSIVSYFRI